MDDRKRLEHYLAWRRAQRKDRRRRIYRQLRIGGTVATLTLALAAMAIALHGWVRQAPHDRVRLPGQAARVPAPLPTSQAVPEAAVPTPATGQAKIEEPPSASQDGMAVAPPPSIDRRPAPSRAERRSAASDTASPGPKAPPLDSRTDGGPSPVQASRPPAVASPIASDAEEEPRRATTEVVVMPAFAPSPTVVVEPPPAPQPASVTTPATGLPEGRLDRVGEETRVEQVKRLVGYIPEVWLTRTVARWVKAQPPGELPPPTPARALPQGR